MASMTKETNEIIADVFSRLPQKVTFRFTFFSRTLSGFNSKIQRTLVLFWSHSGLLTTAILGFRTRLKPLHFLYSMDSSDSIKRDSCQIIDEQMSFVACSFNLYISSNLLFILRCCGNIPVNLWRMLVKVRYLLNGLLSLIYWLTKIRDCLLLMEGPTQCK